jgi:hypothetical protein
MLMGYTDRGRVGSESQCTFGEGHAAHLHSQELAEKQQGIVEYRAGTVSNACV